LIEEPFREEQSVFYTKPSRTELPFTNDSRLGDGRCVGVAEDRQRLLQGVKVVGADQHGGRRPVAGDDHTLVLARHSIDELVQAVTDGSV